KGSQVAVIDTCRTWMGSGRGAQDADNIWCPVLYEGHRGWANAYYLADHGERVACVMYRTARGCASTAGGQSAREAKRGQRWMCFACGSTCSCANIPCGG